MNNYTYEKLEEISDVADLFKRYSKYWLKVSILISDIINCGK